MPSFLSASGVGGSGFRPQWIPNMLSYYDPDDVQSLRKPDGSAVTGSGNSIARWMDRCGNQQCYDLVAQDAAFANYPTYAPGGINSLPAVDFSGTSMGKTSLLYNANYGPQTVTQFTVMLVAQVYQSTNANLAFVSAAKNGVTTDQSKDGFLVRTPNDFTKLELRKNVAAGGIDVTVSINSSPALYTFILDDTSPGSGTGSGLFYFNGGTASSGTDPSAGSTMALDGICFGADYSTQLTPLQFKARDVAVFTRRLTVAELNQLGTYLMAKSAALANLSTFV